PVMMRTEPAQETPIEEAPGRGDISQRLTRFSMARRSTRKKPRKTVKLRASRAAKSNAKAGVGKAGQWVYTFGGGKAQGRANMRELLGGKGAGLAEMANLKLPVPPGFTITTAVCTHYYASNNKYPKDLEKQIDAGLAHIARIAGKEFGDRGNPLLVS